LAHEIAVTRRRIAWILGVLILCGSATAAAQTGANVLVVANGASPASLEIAGYYAAKRQVPADQILRVTTPLQEEVSQAAYQSQIEVPIAQWLARHSAQDRILYIVLTKGIPLRVTGTSGETGTVASVDSELTLLYRKLGGQLINLSGALKNPYFLGDAPVTAAKPFTHRDYDLYLVARLDGYTVADVKGLIDRGAAPSPQGTILLNERAELRRAPGNTWLESAAAALEKRPDWKDRVTLATTLPLHGQSNVLGYYSWGSNDPLISVRHHDLKFVPGALAGMFVSTDARTMDEPPEDWRVRTQPYAGSDQSLTGDLIRDGITGVAGHVAEPYLSGTIRPDVLFPAYVSGFNLVESFYLAMPGLSWQTVVIGDPLCAPFKRQPPAPGDVDPGIDAATELPSFFGARRLDRLVKGGLTPDVGKLFLKAEVRLLMQDRAGGIQALEQATALDGTFVAAQLALANLYEGDSRWEDANTRYRRVLAREPNQAVALNNLAYSLAEHTNGAAEALPLATRAYEISKHSPLVGDTFAWVYHRLNRDREAEPIITAAAQAQPKSAEIHLHAAFIMAGVGHTEAAARELATAIGLDKSLGQRADVRQLRARLGQ
jgi:uncharacterized protein (TIGR03790 family)